MHSIDQLADILGYSEDQVRNRLDTLRPWFDEFIRRGDKNKIFVIDDGLEILRRVKELDDQGVSLKLIPNKVKTELNEKDKENENKEEESVTKVSTKQDQTGLIREKEERIKELKETNEYLRGLIEKKDKKLEEKDEQLHRYLPNPEKAKKSPVQRFWDWLGL